MRGRPKALDDASCEIPRGGVASIIGPNGAGKSTLLSLISRLADDLGQTIVLVVHDIDIRIEEIDGNRIGVYFA